MKDLKDSLAFVGLLVFSAVLVWLFVWWQRQLIADPALFWTLTGILLILSFWTSATEAAYTVVNTLGDPKSLTEKLDKAAQQITQAAADKAKFMEDPTLLSRPAKKLKRLNARRTTLSNDARDNFVGAFASASVFLNTALVAFIPAALIHGMQPETDLKSMLNKTVPPEWHPYLSGEKWLTFAASTLLILIAGKIVPKIIGFNFPFIFAYRLGPLADVVYFLFGWVARGARYPLRGMLKVNRRVGE
jgi:hypothetical protein